jgi:hypothetical protein
MNRRAMIAALTVIGAACFAAAPSYAQQEAPISIPRDKEAPPKAGVAPRVSPFAGAQQGTTSKAATAPSGALPKLNLVPESANVSPTKQ